MSSNTMEKASNMQYVQPFEAEVARSTPIFGAEALEMGTSPGNVQPLKKQTLLALSAVNMPHKQPPFYNLPPEIRLMIWRHAFPASRYVYPLPSIQREAVRSKTDWPVTMWINRESRTETMRHYTLKGQQLTLPCRISDGPPPKPKTLIFNPSRDTLVLQNPGYQRRGRVLDAGYVLMHFLPELTKLAMRIGVRFLILEQVETGRWDPFFGEFLLSLVKEFPGLEELTVTHTPEVEWNMLGMSILSLTDAIVELKSADRPRIIVKRDSTECVFSERIKDGKEVRRISSKDRVS